MGDQRIAVFNCLTMPCSFENEIKLEEITPFSATKSKKGITLIGMKPQSGTGGKYSYLPLHTFNIKGDLLKSGGEGYSVNGHWMLTRPFINGEIRHNPQSNTFWVGYERLPYIYVYDPNFKLVKSFRFDNFILGKQKYQPRKGMLNIVMEDHSLLKSFTWIENNTIIVEIETKKNMRVKDKRYKWDKNVDFYVVNFSDNSSGFVGNITLSDSDLSRFYLTTHGILEKEKSNTFWISFN